MYRSTKPKMQTTKASLFAAASMFGILVMTDIAPACAQTANVQQTPNLEDIVVTARKREEKLLDVPITVTAFSSQAIAARQIATLNDIAAFTPNFTISNTAGSRTDRSFANLIIRGMRPSGVNETTSLFIDGAPLNSSFVEGIDDLERVEIIKGPQSAYFGRDTFAGAVNFITKTPSETFKGHVEALYGSYNWTDLRGSIEGPIIPGVLTARVSARLYERDGQYKNSGGPDRTLGRESTRSFMGTLYFTPAENFTARLTGMIWHDSDGPPATGQFNKADYNCDANDGGALNIICGTLPNFPESRLGQNGVIDPVINALLSNSTGTLNPLYVNPPIDHYGLERRAWHSNLILNYQVPSLGWTLTSVTAGNSDRVYVLNDADIQNTFGLANPLFGRIPNLQPYQNFTLLSQRDQHAFSQEFRVTTEQKARLRGSLGVNYFYSYSQLGVTAAYQFGLGTFNNGEPTLTHTYGIFGSLAYDIFDNLTLNLEGRYQADKVALYSRPQSVLKGPLAAQQTFNDFLPRAILEYKFRPEAQVYASYSEGVNPGVFNNFLLTAAPVQKQAIAGLGAGLVVQPEKLKNYELGIKGRFFDGRAEATAAIYYADWTNQIISNDVTVPAVDANGQPTGNSTVIVIDGNYGHTTFKGLELEAQFAATKHLLLNGSFGYNDPKLKNYICVPCASTTGTTNVTGNTLNQTSKFTATFGASYTSKLTETADWYTRADYTYRSGQYADESNITKSRDVHLVNLRAGIKMERYSVEGFVNNALQSRAPTSIENNINVLNFVDRTINVGMPIKRWFGVRATAKFGGS